MSEQTIYRWKQKYGGLETSELRRLKALEAQNAPLKRLVAEQALDNQTLKEVLSKELVTPAAHGVAACHLQTQFSVSERRACRLIGSHRSAGRYRGRPQPDDTELRSRLCTLTTERPRFGYRRLHKLLQREGY